MIHVFENRDGVLLMEEPSKLLAAGMARRDDADERHAGCGRGTRIVDGVADIPQLAAGLHALDGVQAVGRGLGLRDVLGADDGIEADIGSEARQRDIELITQAAGEDGQIEAPAQSIQQARFGNPAFAANEAVAVLASIAAEEDPVEVVDDHAVFDFDAQIGGDLLRQSPIVVPAAGVLVLLDEIARDAVAGEVLDGLHDGFAIGFGDLRQNAVHVEDDYFFHNRHSSAMKRSAPARVPMVTRTQPEIS